MESLSEQQVLLVLIALAVVLFVGRLAGELARRVGQPEVLGQLLAGFVLGPSVLGLLLPEAYHTVFLNSGVGLVLSGFSWAGVILLLLVAGLEVDLAILRAEAKPGLLAALFAISSSLVAGMLFARFVFGRSLADGFFLGVVLTVTGVSVAARILIEREVLRRRFAQVILAAGVLSEVVVWVLVAIARGEKSGSPLVSGLRSFGLAVAFFLFMMIVGRRVTDWSMRRVADLAGIARAQLTLVLVLTFLSALATHALGLHPLLGAFVFGVLLGEAPRRSDRLLDGIQALTVGVFAPVFFVLAGMRVDVVQLASLPAILAVLLLLVVATAVKVGAAAVGARLGGMPVWEAVLVGAGLNLKGGTDVIVAIIGSELGLLSTRQYTMYALVAILTVLVSPPLIAWLTRRAPPSEAEKERLAKEEAERRSYVPALERVLVPLAPELLPKLVLSVLQRIAVTKQEHGQAFDITELVMGDESEAVLAGVGMSQEALLDSLNSRHVEVIRRKVEGGSRLDAIVEASQGHDLVAIGARPPSTKTLSFGRLQDGIINRSAANVLVSVSRSDELACSLVRRVLVPVNGFEYSYAAADLAASMARSCDAELVFLNVGRAEMTGSQGRDRRKLIEASSSILEEAAFRVGRYDVRISQQVRAGSRPAQEILRELERQPYDLLVMGAINLGSNDILSLGTIVPTVLAGAKLPVLLLVAHAGPDESANGSGTG